MRKKPRDRGRGGRTFAAGDRCGKFLITGLIGEGGMGEVYDALDEVIDRPVALKVASKRRGSVSTDRMGQSHGIDLVARDAAGKLWFIGMKANEGLIPRALRGEQRREQYTLLCSRVVAVAGAQRPVDEGAPLDAQRDGRTSPSHPTPIIE